jgi:hypothetical protein
MAGAGHLDAGIASLMLRLPRREGEWEGYVWNLVDGDALGVLDWATLER